MELNNKPKGYKPFSIGNYKKYSPLEKFIAEKISIENHKILKNPDKYGIDLIIINNEKICGGLEIESHGKYWIDAFPFDTVHFLGRKKKYIGNNNFYLLCSQENKNAVIINFLKLTDNFIVENNNVSCEKELFYDIPKEECLFGWNKIIMYLNNYFNKKLDYWM